MRTTQNQRKYIGADLETMSVAVNYYNWLIQEFGPYIGKKTLEVGAGSGTFSNYLLHSGRIQELYTVEPSTEMFDQQKNELKSLPSTTLISKCGFLNEVQNELPKDFDTIFYINVLEHVEKDLEELKLINGLMKHGAYVCIYVPALQFLYGEFDRKVGHYRRYSKETLGNILKASGFEIIKLNYSDIFGILPWLINFRLLKKGDLSTKSVQIYDRLVIPVVKNMEKLIKPPFGKNLWAIGRKS